MSREAIKHPPQECRAISDLILSDSRTPSERLDDFVGRYDSYVVADNEGYNALLEIAYFEHRDNNITVLVLDFDEGRAWGVEMFTRMSSEETIPAPNDELWQRAETYRFDDAKQMRAFVRDFNDAMIGDDECA